MITFFGAVQEEEIKYNLKPSKWKTITWLNYT